MDKMDLIKNAIKVAASCTAQPNVSGVLKVVCTNFMPDLIDFVAERKALGDLKRAEMEKMGEVFDPFEGMEDQKQPEKFDDATPRN